MEARASKSALMWVLMTSIIPKATTRRPPRQPRLLQGRRPRWDSGRVLRGAAAAVQDVGQKTPEEQDDGGVEQPEDQADEPAQDPVEQAVAGGEGGGAGEKDLC